MNMVYIPVSHNDDGTCTVDLEVSGHGFVSIPDPYVLRENVAYSEDRAVMVEQIQEDGSIVVVQTGTVRVLFEEGVRERLVKFVADLAAADAANVERAGFAAGVPGVSERVTVV